MQIALFSLELSLSSPSPPSLSLCLKVPCVIKWLMSTDCIVCEFDSHWMLHVSDLVLN